ncbi:MAG: accessory factor UbiK family protein [Thiomicrorhabdus sp.]|nr:accessory factor UbiK family protein [Thiomicrorhabdus sp.]
MTQTSGRLFDDLAKVMTDMAGTAQGMRNEVDNAMRGKFEAVLQDFDIVQREEFDAMKEMLLKLRSENEELKKRIEKLEA